MVGDIVIVDVDPVMAQDSTGPWRYGRLMKWV
jgi:hypothetical protein